MPFSRRRRLMPIKSEKEEISFTNLGTNASAVQTINIANATDSPTTAGQVEIGDTINWVFFELNFSAEDITNTKIIHWCIWKNPQASLSLSPSSYDTTSKRWILKRGMEMVPKDVNTIIKRIGVVLLPKGFRRMADSDAIQLKYVASSAETINVCGIFIFKHFG